MFSNSSLWALGVKRMRDVHPRQNILIICLLLPLRVWGFSNKSGPFTTEWSSQRSNRSLFVKRSVPNDDSSIKDFKVIYIIVKSFQSFEDTIAKCKSVTFCLNMKQARKLQATLAQNYHRPSHLLTGVKCRATSVAKNIADQVYTITCHCLKCLFYWILYFQQLHSFIIGNSFICQNFQKYVSITWPWKEFCNFQIFPRML